MIHDGACESVRALASRWWVLMVRGVAAILFGTLAIVAPRISLLALVILWGAYALVDGVFNVIFAIRGATAERSWGWLLFAGVVSIAGGALTFVWPGVTSLLLLAVIAVWSVLRGSAEIATAIRLRRQIAGEWLLATSGISSLAFGVLLLLFPGAGALALLWMIGAYAILFGALLVGLGWRLHRWAGEPPLPTGGAFTPG